MDDWNLIESLRSRRFDLALILTSFAQSPHAPAYLCYLAGIPTRVGQAKDFGGRVLTHQVEPPPDHVNQSERNLHLLESMGIPIPRRDLEVAVPEEAQAVADALLAERGVANMPFVLLAPGASCEARRYDPVRFGEVTRQVVEESGLPAVIVGASNEMALEEQFMSRAPKNRVASLIGKTSVSQLAGVVRRSELVIANNSAPMHLAEALRKPVVVTYSGSDLEEQWAPRSAPSRILNRPTFCTPCYGFRCPYHMECLDIAPVEVASSALQLLAESRVSMSGVA
jgi:ADP-heptose:LPS heptosyltransferase